MGMDLTMREVLARKILWDDNPGCVGTALLVEDAFLDPVIVRIDPVAGRLMPDTLAFDVRELEAL